MTVEEMFRRILRAHWVAIAVCVALPVLAVVVLQLSRRRSTSRRFACRSRLALPARPRRQRA